MKLKMFEYLSNTNLVNLDKYQQGRCKDKKQAIWDISKLALLGSFGIWNSRKEPISGTILITWNEAIYCSNFSRLACKLPGGSSHWHGIRICGCLLMCLFAKFGIAMVWSSTETKEPKFKNWVYFEQIIVKSTQFEQNWVLFYWQWYTNGWVIGRKIGIEKVRFLRFGRHIHVWF